MKAKDQSDLEKEMLRLYGELAALDPRTDAYKEILCRLQTLHEMQDATKQPKKSVSPDTILIATTNVIGIVIVLAYEHAHPVLSKAFSMIQKLPIK